MSMGWFNESRRDWVHSYSFHTSTPPPRSRSYTLDVGSNAPTTARVSINVSACEASADCTCPILSLRTPSRAPPLSALVLQNVGCLDLLRLNKVQIRCLNSIPECMGASCHRAGRPHLSFITFPRSTSPYLSSFSYLFTHLLFLFTFSTPFPST